MSKIISIIIVICIIITGCKFNNSSSEYKELPIISTEESDNTIKEINKLINNNKRCIFEIFLLDILPGNKVKNSDGKIYYQIVSDEFKTLNDLKAFLADTYLKNEVDKLLNNYMDNGITYYEEGGVLFYNINIEYEYNKPYFYVWDDYTFSYADINEKEKELIIHIKEYVNPYEDTDPVFCDATLKSKIILEDGKWKLEKMFWE